MGKISYTQVENTKYFKVVTLKYNFIQYSDNYLKISGSLWQYCRDEPAANNANGGVADFNVAIATTHSLNLTGNCLAGNHQLRH